MFRRPKTVVLVMLGFLILGGCSSFNFDAVHKTPSMGLTSSNPTTLSNIFANDARKAQGKSGIVPITQGEWGFKGRLGLIHAAERSLDLQYYIWENDVTGRHLALALIRAADRGVRVRLLFDDLNLKQFDEGLSILNYHPNIEIRMFNPISRDGLYLFNLVGEFERGNKRMHNKVFVADNTIAIIGGRNVGDDYFGLNKVTNFRDLDVAAVGPVVRQATRAFDDYWNSRWSVPVNHLVKKKITPEEYQKQINEFRKSLEGSDETPFKIPVDVAKKFTKILTNIRAEFIWVNAKVIYDVPGKVDGGEKHVVASELRKLGRNLRRELLIENAYFIPGQSGIESSAYFKKRRIRVRVLTNSLATNDVIAAQAGYAKYRKDLLANNVELYELRPDASGASSEWSLISGTSKAALHTKVAVFDRRWVFVGSYNLDPRSRDLNTEIGILADSRSLADRIVKFMDAGVEGKNSWRLVLEDTDTVAGKTVVWLEDNGQEKRRYLTDPMSGFGRSASQSFMGMLPIEQFL